jgi:hypothetical protein
VAQNSSGDVRSNESAASTRSEGITDESDEGREQILMTRGKSEATQVRDSLGSVGSLFAVWKAPSPREGQSLRI